MSHHVEDALCCQTYIRGVFAKDAAGNDGVIALADLSLGVACTRVRIRALNRHTKKLMLKFLWGSLFDGYVPWISMLSA